MPSYVLLSLYYFRLSKLLFIEFRYKRVAAIWPYLADTML